MLKQIIMDSLKNLSGKSSIRDDDLLCYDLGLQEELILDLTMKLELKFGLSQIYFTPGSLTLCTVKNFCQIIEGAENG